jgi:hypothetical protein
MENGILENWNRGEQKPIIPLFHHSILLRVTILKRESRADLGDPYGDSHTEKE